MFGGKSYPNQTRLAYGSMRTCLPAGEVKRKQAWAMYSIVTVWPTRVVSCAPTWAAANARITSVANRATLGFLKMFRTATVTRSNDTDQWRAANHARLQTET